MTGINTIQARKYWEEKNGEVGYLEAIQFVSLELCEETDELYISLLADEEGNYDTKLTARGAKHVAEKLLELAKDLEGDNVEAVKQELRRLKQEQETFLAKVEKIKDGDVL